MNELQFAVLKCCWRSVQHLFLPKQWLNFFIEIDLNCNEFMIHCKHCFNTLSFTTISNSILTFSTYKLHFLIGWKNDYITVKNLTTYINIVIRNLALYVKQIKGVKIYLTYLKIHFWQIIQESFNRPVIIKFLGQLGNKFCLRFLLWMWRKKNDRLTNKMVFFKENIKQNTRVITHLKCHRALPSYKKGFYWHLLMPKKYRYRLINNFVSVG